MAQNSCRNVLHVLGSISCLLLLVHKASAYEFRVGGDGVWKVPSNNASNPYIQWAINNRFQINDTIVFKFQDNKDSVLVVSEKDYKKCDTSRPIESYSGGNGGQQTTVTLSHSGPFYFISGLHCDQNEKLVVVVLADRRRHHHGAAPPPQSTNPPAPAPAGEGSPPPPPSGPSPSVLINPTPAPSSLDTPPSNSGGFQIVSGFVSSIGVTTLVGSLLLLF